METCNVMAKPASSYEQVKITADVVKSARIVCAYRGEGLATYMSGLLAPLVARDLAEEQRKAQAPAPPARSPLPGQTSFIDPGKGRKGGSKSK